MNSQERVIQHKLKVLRHADQTGNVAKTCQRFSPACAGNAVHQDA